MPPNWSDRDDPSGDSGRPTGLLSNLRAIIRAFAEIETDEDGHRRESGHIKRGGTSIDYDYEVSIGLGSTVPSDPPRTWSPTEFSRDPEGDSPPLHIETRDVDETERVVLVDLPGTVEEEIDLAIDSEEDALELRVSEERTERVALGTQDVRITDVTLNNQVLTVRLERTGDENGSESNDR